ncbi:MAG: beta-galactosidase [Bacteroidales bacterium]|nr:beta-galactosidase [Bacteroidales bacterium]
MIIKKLLLLLLTSFLIAGCAKKDNSAINLSGEWKFSIDSLDEGITEKWFLNELDESVRLPGSMAENGKGNQVGFHTKWLGGIQKQKWFEDKNYKPYLRKDEFLFPFWLSPSKHYYGAAWYQKTIVIPSSWNGESIELFLERCHWETQIWVDGKKAGMQNSLGTPHRYDLTGFLDPGKHRISIMVDNRMKEVNVGPNSHSVSDHTQGNWNGITGKIHLIKKPPVFIKNVKIFPDIQNKTLNLKILTENKTDITYQASLIIQVISKNPEKNQKSGQTKQIINIEKGLTSSSIQYKMDAEIHLWDEFNPHLYNLKVELKTKAGKDLKEVQFGMRDFKAKGSRFTINGRPLFLRGTLDCAAYPETGYPPSNEEEWESVIQTCKAHGLNHIRFHSWCPPEAAFNVADSLGFYYQVECSSWANQGSSVGDGNAIDKWIYEESERMIDAYGNHPSFVMMAYGNEPAGENMGEYLNNFVNYWKNKDPRRVYTSAAGWPALEANEFHNLPGPRIQGWGEQLISIINNEPPRTDYDWNNRLPADGKPVISHEIGQWCAYPDFNEIEKYKGVLKAKNFELFQASLKAHHMGHLADSFLLASGKLQAICYKADIEAALRTPDFAGFQLLGLSDFPGQGTALVGVLNAFWKEKGYVSPQEFSRFCNETVPLARLKKRIFLNNEAILADIEVAHFGEKTLERVTPTWKIVDNHGKTRASGSLMETNIPIGNAFKLGIINVKIKTDKPVQLKLEVNIAGFENSWNIWVYPSDLPEVNQSELIYVSHKLDDKAKDILEQGGKVLITIKKGSIKPDKGGNVGIGFSSIFWNTAWTGGQKPHTLGILCNPDHPALADFPTSYHSDWQWWDAMSHSNAISLEGFSTDVIPIVRVIDDWVTNRRLALIFEAKVGNGKVLFSGIDLYNDMEIRPEARQLLFSLKEYMADKQFDPKVRLEAEQIGNLFN